MTPRPPRLPGNLPHLQRLANAAANAQSVPLKHYQRWMNVQILSAALERVRDADGEPLFARRRDPIRPWGRQRHVPVDS